MKSMDSNANILGNLCKHVLNGNPPAKINGPLYIHTCPQYEVHTKVFQNSQVSIKLSKSITFPVVAIRKSDIPCIQETRYRIETKYKL